MLTKEEIKKQISLGNINITNLTENSLTKPNSCNVTLGDTLYVYNEKIIDARNQNIYLKEVMYDLPHNLKKVAIPSSGLLLEPFKVYLAKTVEKVTTNGFIPIINGKVSLSLLGLSITHNNEYKDNCYDDYLLLSIICTKPTIIYPYIPIGNLIFEESLIDRVNYGMLSGKEIERRMALGTIIINNKDNIVINPNSINLTLNKKMGYYVNDVIDLKGNNEIKEFYLEEEGTILSPNEVYLARTNEWTESYDTVPMLNGRSSLGRLGMHVHCSGGMGSIGYKGYWHLGIRTTSSLKVYPNMKCCQIYYLTPYGKITNYYEGSMQMLGEDLSSQYTRVLKNHKQL